jgi:hypothetical protein
MNTVPTGSGSGSATLAMRSSSTINASDVLIFCEKMSGSDSGASSGARGKRKKLQASY